jgi:hypothetical protein
VPGASAEGLFTNFVEEKFCELRLYTILGSSFAGSCIAPVHHPLEASVEENMPFG